MSNANRRKYEIGDVFQINERHGRRGWIGAFVTATEINVWGIQGFVHCLKTHDEYERAYIRLSWDAVCYIGGAALIPQDVHITPETSGSIRYEHPSD